jgi:hypothetical protein
MTLYDFQLTIQSEKEYDILKLDEEFVSIVRKQLDFDYNMVYFVVLKITDFDPPSDNAYVTFKSHQIDFTSLESTAISLQSLFNFLRWRLYGAGPIVLDDRPWSFTGVHDRLSRYNDRARRMVN